MRNATSVTSSKTTMKQCDKPHSPKEKRREPLRVNVIRKGYQDTCKMAVLQ